MSRDPASRIRSDCLACGTTTMSSGDITSRFQIGYRQLDYLAVQLGWAGMGPSNYRRWSTAEVAAIAAFTACTQNGLQRKIALEAARVALERARRIPDPEATDEDAQDVCSGTGRRQPGNP